MPQTKAIRIEKRGEVDWLTLNRPDRLNTLTGTMVEELCAYFAQLESAPIGLAWYLGSFPIRIWTRRPPRYRPAP
jgi:enoyl-CoA hydratase/carnithine racemase